jgi:large subunit ribosomal protein L16
MIQKLISERKKLHKSRIKGFEQKKHLNQLVFGNFGLKALENGRITPKQIETLRRGLSRFIKKNTAQIWFRQAPTYSISQKPTEIRMGKGKGNVVTRVIRIRAGSIFCEIEGLSDEVIVPLLLLVSTKLGIRSGIIRVRRYF